MIPEGDDADDKRYVRCESMSMSWGACDHPSQCGWATV